MGALRAHIRLTQTIKYKRGLAVQYRVYHTHGMPYLHMH